MSNLESQSKLMYYPTDKMEIYRMLGIVGKIEMSIEAREEIKQLLGEEQYLNLLNSAINSFSQNFATSVYSYFLEQGRIDLLKEYLEVQIGYSHNSTVTILDPFAGEGEWLKLMKAGIPCDEINSANIHLIANELETNRYNTMIEDEIIDEHYNKAFEELEDIPKGSISLLLYNPPYGDTNGIRNVYHYLEMIVERGIIHKSDSLHSSGKMIMVVRKDDLLESLSLAIEHFEIDDQRIYQVNKEEYDRYKQYVVYATLRSKPLDIKSVNGALFLQQEISRFTDIINSDPQFNSAMYNTTQLQPPQVPYTRLKENHELIKEGEIELSTTNGDSWNWFKDLTTTRQAEHVEINKATPLKIGELSNLIASGMINGEMQLSDSEGYHVVAGGMKEQVSQELLQEENRKGELINKTKTVIYSQPYLNILINENGKVRIKELEGGNDLE